MLRHVKLPTTNVGEVDRELEVDVSTAGIAAPVLLYSAFYTWKINLPVCNCFM